MHMDTGKLYDQMQVDDLRKKAAGDISARKELDRLMLVTQSQAEKLAAMSPPDRVAWADARRRTKNQRKAQRRARRKNRGGR